jgi:hypothetical protein
MSTHPNENHAHRTEHRREPPTLPLPSLWRLVVAAVVVIAFLYLMYSTYTESPPPPAQGQSSSLAIVSSRA